MIDSDRWFTAETPSINPSAQPEAQIEKIIADSRILALEARVARLKEELEYINNMTYWGGHHADATLERIRCNCQRALNL
jgi:hypothetical protein